MFFCKNCSRLLEEDLKKCPHCGALEEGYEESVDSGFAEPDTSQKSDAQEPGASGLNELNQMINESKEKTARESAYREPEVTIEQTISGAYQRTTEPLPQNEISGLMKVFLIALSIIIPIAGIIVGAIYMGKADKEYKSFGKTLLIISIVIIVLSIICCCAFYMVGVSMVGNGFYESLY